MEGDADSHLARSSPFYGGAGDRGGGIVAAAVAGPGLDGAHSAVLERDGPFPLAGGRVVAVGARGARSGTSVVARSVRGQRRHIRGSRRADDDAGLEHEFLSVRGGRSGRKLDRSWSGAGVEGGSLTGTAVRRTGEGVVGSVRVADRWSCGCQPGQDAKYLR